LFFPRIGIDSLGRSYSGTNDVQRNITADALRVER
jgi:hypothetical protein